MANARPQPNGFIRLADDSTASSSGTSTDGSSAVNGKRPADKRNRQLTVHEIAVANAPAIKRSAFLTAIFGAYTSLPHVPTFYSWYGLKTWFRTSRLPPGTIEYHVLLHLFTPGLEVIDFGLPGEDTAFVVERAAFTVRDGVSVCVIEGYHYDWMPEGCYGKMTRTTTIRSFIGLEAINNLPCQPLTDRHRERLAKRGREYIKYANKPVHVALHSALASLIVQVLLDGHFLTTSNDRSVRTPTVGPAMVDQVGYLKMHPSSNELRKPKDPYAPEHESPMVEMPEAKLHLLPAFLNAYSCTHRLWGLVTPEHIRPYSYEADAWDLLQMDDLAKQTLRALVEAPRVLSDAIQRKSCGTWILLHGQSGTGKTFCAQAVAALLKRPIVHVSAGELSRSPVRMERTFLELVETAELWNAVLVIDDAEVLLGTGDMSISSIFYDVLENYKAVGIMTTTTAKMLDRPALSRFSLIVHLGELEEQQRRNIWLGLLARAHVVGIAAHDTERWASERLNGRAILHTIQAAQTVARFEGRPLAPNHVDRLIRLRKTALSDMRMVDEDGIHLDEAEGRVLFN